MIIRVLISSLLFLLAGSSATAQSQFYVTFERSFSTNEEVQLRLDYMRPGLPLHVSILKPKSIETFLDGQFNISRTYEEPRAALNAGYYLANGLNKIESPLPDFRKLLSAEFRTSFNGLLSPPLRASTGKNILNPPAKITTEAPTGFDLVKTLDLDLQRGGEKGQDSWWWFFDSAPTNGSFLVRSVSLGKIPSGLYLVQVTQGEEEAQALLQVSDIGVQVKQGSNELLVRVVDRSGSAVSSATIAVRNSSGKWSNLSTVTDGSGQLFESDAAKVLGSELDGKLILRVTTQAGVTAFTETDFVSSKPDQNSLFIATDRPIFKPGERVSFKGVLRRESNGGLALPEKVEPSTLKLVSTDGVQSGEISNVKMSEYGSLSGEFTLDSEASPGLYRLVTTTSGRTYSGETRVRDYVKPTFYIRLVNSSGELRPGKKFSFSLKATRYAGGAPQDLKYEVFVYRKKFTVPSFVEESGGGLQTGDDYFGNKQSASALSQPQRIYSSLEARAQKQNGDSNAAETSQLLGGWNSAPEFTPSGDVSTEIQLPPIDQQKDEEWIYTLLVRAKASDGSEAVLSEDFIQTLTPGVVSGKFANTVIKPGSAPLRYSVRVTDPQGVGISNANGEVQVSWITPSGQRKLSPTTFVTRTDGYATVEISISDLKESAGILRALAVVSGANGDRWSRTATSETAEAVVADDSGSAVRSSSDLVLIPETTLLSPGEKTRVVGILPDSWGKNNTGTVWRTIAGAKVFSSEGREVSGRSFSYETEAKESFGTGYFESVTAPISDGKFREGSASFRVIPWKKRLFITLQPEKEIGEPSKPFVIKAVVTDSEKNTVPNVEVAIGVVDRAVYAVQPEFRPNIIDFFFPLPRLNLMTFYSDDLQGYGYADTIRKPNFSLTALKSQSKLSKRAVRDTAGWYPHLVTDQQGQVSVTVDMPANLTEWLITSFAVDKSGRVGENTGQFRTATDLVVEPRTPQFLREGDSVTLPIVSSTELVSGASFTVAATAMQGSKEVGRFAEQKRELKSASQVNDTFKISAERNNQPVLISVKVGHSSESSTLKTGGSREFEIPVKSSDENFELVAATTTAGLSSTKEGTATLHFKINDAVLGKIQAKEINVTASDGAVALVTAISKSLVTYPYGCAEQLAHTILPNVALLSLADTVPGIFENSSSMKPLISKAKGNAESGIRQLSGYQKKNGGFSLWPTDPEPSPTVTLLVASVLNRARESGVQLADELLYPAISWLEKDSNRTTWSPYELQIFSELSTNVEVADQQITFVKSVLNEKVPSLQSLVLALQIVDEFADKSWHAFSVGLAGSDAKRRLIDKLVLQIEIGANNIDSKNNFSEEDLGFRPALQQYYAAALRTLSGVEPVPAKAIEILRMKLFEDFNSTGFAVPFESAQVVKNLLPFVKKQLEKNTQSQSSVSVVDGSGVPLCVLKKEKIGFSGSCPIPSVSAAHHSRYTVVGLPAGATVVGVLSGSIPAEDASRISEPFGTNTSEKNISVTRTLSRILPTGTENLSRDSVLNVGDVIVSKLEVSRLSSAPQTGTGNSDWFVVRDSVPSIAELIDDDKNYLADAKILSSTDSIWSTVKQTLRYPEKIERVVRLSQGSTFASYSVWRVGYEGKALLPPAKAADIYNPLQQTFSVANVLLSGP